VGYINLFKHQRPNCFAQQTNSMKNTATYARKQTKVPNGTVMHRTIYMNDLNVRILQACPQ
jgi:hypothetical protein